MKLKDFISAMKEGWGFRSPHRVMDIGSALETLFAGSEELEKEVEIEHKVTGFGRGPDSRTRYGWSVRGVDAPIAWGKLAPDATDRLFGYTAESLPIIYEDDDGFVVSFIS